MISVFGWVGDVFLIAGIWEIGNRRRRAHLLTVVGELAWIARSLMLSDYALALICTIFLVLAMRCWVLWADPV